ncbi:MAG: GxxExxY protein [Candidatus Magasanikbacteria bacterium CG_4_9_14_0_2_um_filter_42_11]|uniref:GxxExxY protein n=1 Tax=Candidatus Magasanikbacteria bacterium CG_4_9_14_0_2_um_filter_42_11 TaxID=1974643 RepID=A0A2M8F9W7_9BACT|nr:MAG: GxxExxY protein [Candidatus Magasanikbacteria bacterium CG10_big_fil_rev_8_21_14_0_10_43_9]PIY92978.1 MAG: GxxExxY protein [Candidatus Magasanikbacteria bacterium CG_4_10_14_0_8_um_filter_42_12]PJC52525.1 MAG: GxxExxY protein [Candidatus Magasanikbacteria bacterium CG_4_9_14_0_2_um_filter_42_11]
MWGKNRRFRYSDNSDDSDISMEGSLLIFKEETYILRGLFFQVQNELGRYRNEKQYGDAFEHKLKENGIQYEREKILPMSFEGEQKGRNRIDFLVFGKIIVELKHNPSFSRDDYYQCQRYLVSADMWLALLVNFQPKYVNIKRILNHQKYNEQGGFTYPSQ